MHAFLLPPRPLGFPTLLLSAVALSALVGCYTSEPAYAPGPRYVTVGDPGDYVYYPAYEVYYSSRQQRYIYRERNVWVTSPQPPRVWARVLPQAPSVYVHFQDAPERHHAEVVRSYPKNWSPPPGHDRDGRERRRDHDERDRDHRDDSHH